MPGMTGSGTSQSSSMNQTTTPIIPSQWQTNYNNANSNLTGGLTPGQTTANNYFSGMFGTPNYAQYSPLSTYEGIATGAPGSTNYGASPFFDISGAISNTNSGVGNALSNFYGSQINGLPQAQSGGTASSSTIQPTSASSYLPTYQNAYQSMVGNPVLSAFDLGTQNTLAGMDAARGASSAFGDRAANADASFLSDQAAQRAQLASQLLGQGFNTSAGLAQGDASTNLAAQTSNASNALQSSEANAQLQAQINEFNASQQQAAQNTYLQGLQNQIGNLGAQANAVGAGQTSENTALGNLTNYLGGGASGLSSLGTSSTDQLANLLKIGLATFGSNTTGTQSGSSTSGGFDFSNPLTAALLFG